MIDASVFDFGVADVGCLCNGGYLLRYCKLRQLFLSFSSFYREFTALSEIVVRYGGSTSDHLARSIHFTVKSLNASS